MLFREWVALTLILGSMACAILSSLASCKSWNVKNSSNSSAMVEAQITIDISGAVDHPGAYYFPSGVSMKELLKKITLSSSADRRKLPLQKIFFQSQKLVIPHKSASSTTRRKGFE